MQTNELEIHGTLEKVIFHNEDNGYTVLSLNPNQKGQSEITVVGSMPKPELGVSLKVRGTYVTNSRFGRQFKMTSYEQERPADLQGIKVYLSSGLIKGIGPAFAEKIVKKFGLETFHVMDTDIDQLSSISGITQKKLEQIKNAWEDHTNSRELIVFLQAHNITVNMAVRIYRYYGSSALNIVKQNPYRLALDDISGIGFVRADELAKKLGFDENDSLRAKAATLYMLSMLNSEGHVYYPKDRLVALIHDKFNVQYEGIEDAINDLALEERIFIDELEDCEAIYLARYHMYETKLSYYLSRIINSPKSITFLEPEEAVQKVIKNLNLELAAEQKEAVITAAKAKVMVLTGGPGTGKTTIVKGIIELFAEKNAKILMAAPTGRAAKRMGEAVGREAKTIHRLLEYSPTEEGFAKNENNPLTCGLLVIDEASMMDLMLAYHLLKAVPAGATVVFVGDINQLPSVGAGNVLKDFINSGAMPVVELLEVFRQAAESEIITNAHRINKGEVPPLEASKEVLSDFYFLRNREPGKIAEMIVDLVQNHIPRRFKLDSIEDIQVLTPMHKGDIGSSNLNDLLQKALGRKNSPVIKRGDKEFKLGDKVMQIRNNYDKDVFNGDIGRISHIDTTERTLSVKYDDRIVPYESDELDEIVMAYAISIHKSQGSEYPAVVIPVSTQHFIMLQRNLIYTGITRGKKLVILVGETKALAIAVGNNKMQKRFTHLANRLSLNNK